MVKPDAEILRRLFAPAAGRAVDHADVPDPVCAGKVQGDGLPIDPMGDQLAAAFDGRVVNLQPSNHAITLRARTGPGVLMHSGIDTVGLKVQGVRSQIAEGDAMRQGKVLIQLERKKITGLVPSTMIPVIVTNVGFATGPIAPAEVTEGAVVLTQTLTPAGAARAAAPVAIDGFSLEAVLIGVLGPPAPRA